MASFFSSVQRYRSTFLHYALLPYVLSTSFSTHPKPLTWNKKPFQSRRVPLSTFFDTMRLFSFFRHCETDQISHFFPNFIHCSPHQFFDILQQKGCSKIPKGPLLHCSALCELPETSEKNSKKNSGNIFPFLVFLRAFVVSSCRKSGFRVLLSLGYGADLACFTYRKRLGTNV